jgi:hypothetical protein
MPGRQEVHVGLFFFAFALVVALVAAMVLIQGAGVFTVNSDRLVLNGIETLVLVALLTFVGTFLLVEFFLIGIPIILI